MGLDSPIQVQISVRLDEPLRAAIAQWMAENQIDRPSAAVRTLLALGVGQKLEPRAFFEGFTQGRSELYRRLESLLSEIKSNG